MIQTIAKDDIPSEAFPDPYHHIVPLSLLYQERPQSEFFQGTGQVYAGYQPDTGFCYYNPERQQLGEWTRWLRERRIRLLAGEAHAHYGLLEHFSLLANEEGEDSPDVYYRYELQDFCIHDGVLPPQPQIPLKIKRATRQDLSRLFHLYECSEYMQLPRHNLEYVIEHNRVFYLQKMGKVVSIALTHCESQDVGLIGGVYTPKAHRGKGYGYACMWTLMHSLQVAGKKACLFYEKNNQAARQLYHKMGYRPYGEWALIELSYERPANLSEA